MSGAELLQHAQGGGGGGSRQQTICVSSRHCKSCLCCSICRLENCLQVLGRGTASLHHRLRPLHTRQGLSGSQGSQWRLVMMTVLLQPVALCVYATDLRVSVCCVSRSSGRGGPVPPLACFCQPVGGATQTLKPLLKQSRHVLSTSAQLAKKRQSWSLNWRAVSN